MVPYFGLKEGPQHHHGKSKHLSTQKGGPKK